MPIAAALALAGSIAAVASGATAQDVLPDLRMARPAEIRVVTLAGGRRLLRLTTTIVNAGRGPFEVRAARTSATATTMAVRQRIRRSDGTWRVMPTGAVARWAGDGHDHWHVQRVASYELFTLDGAPAATGAKVGFCFFDTRREGYLGSTILAARYHAAGCGVRRSTSVVMGISAGWGDVYAWNLAYQWLDVTGLSGTFWLRLAADPQDLYDERSETNNCSWARVTITRRSGDVAVGARGTGCQPPDAAPLPAPLPTPAPTPVPEPPDGSPAPSSDASPPAGPGDSPAILPGGTASPTTSGSASSAP